MYDAIDARKALIDFAVDMALKVTWLCILFNRFGGLNMILDQIVWRAQQGWRHVARHPESGSIIWRSDGDVPVRIENIMTMEDVRCSNQAFKQILESNLFTLGKVSGRHIVNAGLQRASRAASESCMGVITWMYDDVHPSSVVRTMGWRCLGPSAASAQLCYVPHKHHRANVKVYHTQERCPKG